MSRCCEKNITFTVESIAPHQSLDAKAQLSDHPGVVLEANDSILQNLEAAESATQIAQVAVLTSQARNASEEFRS